MDGILEDARRAGNASGDSKSAQSTIHGTDGPLHVSFVEAGIQSSDPGEHESRRNHAQQHADAKRGTEIQAGTRSTQPA